MNSEQGLLSNLNPEASQIESEPYQLTGADSWDAAWELAGLTTATEAAGRYLSLKIQKYQTQDEPKLDPKELNARFPDLQQKFDEPLNLYVANEIATRQKERQVLQDKVNAGPQDGFYGFANKWGANLLAHAVDPVELGAGIIVGMGLPAVAGGTAIGARLGVGAAAEATVGQTILRGSVEGAIGNVIGEVPVYAAERQEKMDYDVETALVGAIGTAAGMSVLHGGLKLGKNGLDRFLGRVSPKHAQAIQQAGIAQVIEGKRIDVEPVVKEMTGDTNFTKNQYVKLADEVIPETKFYSPKEIVTSDVNAPSAVISDDYGSGIYLTDDPAVANGAAARKLADNDGSILAGKVQNAALVDLDTFQAPGSKFADALTAAAEGTEFRFEDFTSGKQLFDQIHDAIEDGKLPKEFLGMLQFQSKIRGIDGYRFTVDKLGDQPHAPHNAMVLFDGNKFVKEENLVPDKNMVPKASKEEVQSVFDKNQSVESSIHYDAQKTPEFEKIVSNPPPDPKVAEFKKGLETINEELDSQIEALGDHPHAKELIKLKEELKLDAKKSELESTVIKAAGDCLGR